MTQNGTARSLQPTTQEWTSLRLVAFDEDQFKLFMRMHKNWTYGYRVFHYGKIYQSPETGETVYEGQERLYPPVPWMQPAR